ncbi:MAG: Asp23/Gls24 family envelope stress response protein [Firmicutes bacterium]|nr:Asp23/Gls24 family envelope stress response protein [Bacillota bacterium]
MSQQIRLELGSIYISEQVIATFCGVAAMECYGLVGMAPRNVQEGLSELLRRDNYDRGVDVQLYDDNSIGLRLYVVVQYGLKISEVAKNIQERVRYTVEKHLGLNVRNIDIRVQGVRVTDIKRK